MPQALLIRGGRVIDPSARLDARLDVLVENGRIAQNLAEGQSTTAVAGQFGLTLGRVSQLRRRFEKSWLSFHGEEPEKEQMPVLEAA